MPNLGQNRWFFVPCDLDIWRMTLKNNRAHLLYYVKLWASFQIWRMTLKNNRALLLCYFKLCASFHSHQWIKTGVTVSKCPIWFKISDFFYPSDLEIWRMTLKNNRAPLLSNIKLCAWFHRHMQIQSGVTVRKQLNWVLTSVTLTFDLDLLHGHHFSHW